MVDKVISGGQVGVDKTGLLVAAYLGIPTGGTAPKGFRTEEGSKRKLLESLGLVEDESAAYEPRTKQNVKDADGTVIYGNANSPGSKLTVKLCRELKKLYLVNPTTEEFHEWVKENEIKVLNIAGNRSSKLSLKQLDDITMAIFRALSEGPVEQFQLLDLVSFCLEKISLDE